MGTSAPKDAGRVVIDLREKIPDVGAGIALPVSLEAAVAISPVQRPPVALLHVRQAGDRHPGPLGSNESAPWWLALEDRESSRRLVDLDAHLVAELRRRLLRRPLADSVRIELGDHRTIIASVLTRSPGEPRQRTRRRPLGQARQGCLERSSESVGWRPPVGEARR